MLALRRFRCTEAEYLAFERANQEKHEFIDGEVRQMPPANRDHNLIATSTLANLHNQLRHKPYFVYISNMRLCIPSLPAYLYPDVCVSPDPDQVVEDGYDDNLLNPIMLIEIYSPASEAYDRGDKFERYRTIESFQEYILIAQDRILIEQHIRQPDERWITTYVQQPDGVIELPSIGCQLSVAEVYEQITFEESASDEIIEA